MKRSLSFLLLLPFLCLPLASTPAALAQEEGDASCLFARLQAVAPSSSAAPLHLPEGLGPAEPLPATPACGSCSHPECIGAAPGSICGSVAGFPGTCFATGRVCEVGFQCGCAF